MGMPSFSYVCISNNPNLKGHVKSLDYLDGGALDVLKAGRDLIHLGWELLADPLYGNFKPNQQPYRSLILKKDNIVTMPLNMESLNLIENAIEIYKGASRLTMPGDLPEKTDDDFRYLDFVLLEETFHQYSVLTPPAVETAAAII
ncbi:MAG: GrdX family protein [Cloacibacillus sp.]